MRLITVREHARLTTGKVEPTLDIASISEGDFDWLLSFSARLSRTGARLVEMQGRRTLAVDNYVGVLEMPSGIQLEIVPKHADAGDDLEQLRALVLTMIARALDIVPRAVDEAHLRTLRYPLSEWLALQFLQRLDELTRRGVRFEYQRVEEESRYLRGQLDVQRQVLQLPARQHLFQVRHDIFTPNRPENRLLRLALDIVNRRMLSPGIRRLANILSGYLHELPASQDFEADLESWSSSRLMAHYAPVKPWCELIVRGNNPFAQHGGWRGLSMLFPMERLFERYVAASLANGLSRNTRLTAQARAHFLCTHEAKTWFLLSPDLVIDSPSGKAVLDTKWKVLNSWAPEDKYGLSQQDFYQLFAYGQHYLKGSGDLFLIYPASRRFAQALPPFLFSDHLRLWVVPFDLTAGTIVPGEWMHEAPWWPATKQPLSHQAGAV